MALKKRKLPPKPGGTKHDEGKVCPSLISTIALFKLAEVLTDGKVKYSAHNWRNGFYWSRVSDALLRHFLMWKDGLDKDPDSRRSNLGAVLFCAMVLAEFEETHPELDDRHKIPLEILYKYYPPKDKNTISKLLEEANGKETTNRKAQRKRASKTNRSTTSRRKTH